MVSWLKSSKPSSSPGESLGAFVFDLKAHSRSVTCSWNVGVKPFNKKNISRYICQKWSKLGIICWLVDYIHVERMYEKTNSKIVNLNREMGLIWDEQMRTDAAEVGTDVSKNC